MKEILIASTAFGFFILCPRMAGMAKVISGASEISIVKTTALGMVFAFPLVICMALVFAKWGLIAALIFAVATDLLAALMMSQISLTSGLETLIIAAFVIIGVKVAGLVSSHVGS